MAVGSAKKTPSKARKSPAHTRKSASKALKKEISTPVAQETPTKRAKDQTFSHHLPTDEQRRSNGRVLGRNLIAWNRPRMEEKLLLHMQYECSRHKIELPWDSIAHRFHPGSSGAAIQQHLNRLRKELLSKGHLVPPMAQRPGSITADLNIRGYIREEGEDGTFSTRAVSFSEKIEDRRFNLPGAHPIKDDDGFQDGEVFYSGTNVQNSPTLMRRASQIFAPRFHAANFSFQKENDDMAGGQMFAGSFSTQASMSFDESVEDPSLYVSPGARQGREASTSAENQVQPSTETENGNPAFGNGHYQVQRPHPIFGYAVPPTVYPFSYSYPQHEAAFPNPYAMYCPPWPMVNMGPDSQDPFCGRGAANLAQTGKVETPEASDKARSHKSASEGSPEPKTPSVDPQIEELADKHVSQTAEAETDDASHAA